MSLQSLTPGVGPRVGFGPLLSSLGSHTPSGRDHGPNESPRRPRSLGRLRFPGPDTGGSVKRDHPTRDPHVYSPFEVLDYPFRPSRGVWGCKARALSRRTVDRPEPPFGRDLGLTNTPCSSGKWWSRVGDTGLVGRTTSCYGSHDSFLPVTGRGT